MATVLDALAPYVKKLLTDMAEEEVSMLLGVSGEITKLGGNIESLKAFFADAERRRITDLSVQGWVRKLKDAMYDATDIIDLCELEADSQRALRGGSMEQVPMGCFQPLLFCLRNPKFAHKIGRRIKELNQRLDGIHREAHRFNFINLGSYHYRRMPTDAEPSSQRMTSEFVESAIVGEKIENDTRELAHWLTTYRNHDIKVVSIVGAGGMGKTTLAQKIFNATTVKEHFKGESTGRFLLVLDDVWSDRAWSHVLSVPVRNASKKQPGNGVLITTRLGDLAQRMGASFYQHHVSLLNDEDAWSLLKKQLPPPPNQQVLRSTDHLRAIGMKIVKKCGGLPLAIKVVGGLLSKRSQSEQEWEAILHHHVWSVAGLPEELDKRIYLSYEDLSPQLKQCFLYCSLFPKGTKIVESIVIPMWISEGFIQPRDGTRSHDDRLEETATDYYRELITRNLIEPTGKYNITGYKCTMHDVVRSFAEFMAKEESLVVIQDDMQAAGGNSLVHRLSIGPTRMTSDWAISQKQKGTLRTLIINCRINFRPGDSLTSFSNLRLLFVKYAGCDGLVLAASICQLRHLRYIRLEKTDISRLPEDINRMKFLQHIVLRKCSSLNNLPRRIVGLEHLRTINIRGSNVRILIPRGFGGLTNLRTLYGFPIHMGDDGWCSLEEIGPLSKLRGVTLHFLENVSDCSMGKRARIRNKEHLSYLELNWRSRGFMGLMDGVEKQHQQKVVEEVLEELCPPSCIQHLQIEEYFGRQLPNWMMVPATTAFTSLRYLGLIHLPCCTQLPDGLCLLPILEWLQIKDAPSVKSVGPEFQGSSSMAVKNAGPKFQASSSLSVGGGVIATSAAFPNLTNLFLEGLCEWQDWDWEEQSQAVTAGAMAIPGLKSLKIDNCKLSCLPPGLANSRRDALRQLFLHELTNLTSVDNFSSVVELDVFDCPKLMRISGLSRLHKIRIFRCPNVEVLEGVPSLDSMELKDATMEALPGYLRGLNPRYLKLTCSRKLYDIILTCSSSEYDKISHILSRTIDYFPEDEN
ncbi:hypothetical protein SETIT_8G155900v2 [Setaria italica]|uniref:AAA+ ATPase domain-containing protein n=1 Tax=Setaria italica TaxID=4555 RepID=A0A368S838_SETIT|nr:hypothetical protein SETIT_8G155900v2 [Setaria italica]